MTSMLRKMLLASALGVTALATAPTVAAPLPDAVPARVLALPTAFEGAKLSPNGTKIAAKMLINGKMQLVVSPVVGGATPTLAARDDMDINWWRWFNDDWLLVGIGNTINLYGADAYATRLAAVSADLKTFKAIDWEKSGLYADRLIHVPSQGTKFLFAKMTGFEREDDWGYSVFEGDIATGKARLVIMAQNDINRWYADSDGAVRLGHAYNEARRQHIWYYRDSDKGDFKAYPDDGSLPVPIVFRKDGSAITISDKGGFDEVYEMALPSFTLGKKLYAVSGYDVDSVVKNETGDGVSGFAYVGKRPTVEWMEPKLKFVQSQIDRAAGPGNASIVSWNRDRTKVLVELGDANQAGALYFWDTQGGSPRLMGWNNEELKDRKLSPVKSVTYAARDGTTIEAVLTLPRGREAKNLPMIVLPHGGPGVRDIESYDWWTQYLAELGYAVIQPNYRGSTGYGTAFHEKGDGEFGMKMQDDLVDAAQWLAKQGIADPKRACIAGASYGGYAAMRGAQRDGDTFRCAISFAGVSDLNGIMKYDRQFFIGENPKKYWRKFAPDFRTVSPLYHAAEINTPILIMHGAKDKRVPVRQSRDMVTALQRAGKKVTYVEQPKGDHHFSREEDRVQFLEEMKAFLDRHNPA